MAVALPVASILVSKNQDNRNRAAGSVINTPTSIQSPPTLLPTTKPTQTPTPASFSCNSKVGSECGYAGGLRCCSELGLECNTTSKTCQKVFPTTPPVQANSVSTNVPVAFTCKSWIRRPGGCPCKIHLQCASNNCFSFPNGNGTFSKECTTQSRSF